MGNMEMWVVVCESSPRHDQVAMMLEMLVPLADVGDCLTIIFPVGHSDMNCIDAAIASFLKQCAVPINVLKPVDNDAGMRH